MTAGARLHALVKTCGVRDCDRQIFQWRTHCIRCEVNGQAREHQEESARA